MRGRRWPIITFSLIGLNVFVFLLTKGPIEEQQPERARVRVELVVLAAAHPELHISPDASAYVESVKKRAGDRWDQLVAANRSAAMNSPGRDPQVEETAELQRQMDSFCEAFETQENSDILDRYAFVPARPRLLAYLTANFLHGGWLHLIGNMWFLWLAGFILEDNWGRFLYTVFYLVAGAAALEFYAWCAPGS